MLVQTKQGEIQFLALFYDIHIDRLLLDPENLLQFLLHILVQKGLLGQQLFLRHRQKGIGLLVFQIDDIP